MTRLEQLNKITKLETNKANIEKLCKDLKSFYAESVTINASVVSKDFKKHYECESISLPLDELELFLRTKSKSLDNEIKDLIDSLK